MTPKEKAKELVDRYYNIQDSEDLGSEQLNRDMEILYEERGEELEPYWKRLAKDSALLLVDEILKVSLFYNDTQGEVTYWKEVKQEVENL